MNMLRDNFVVDALKGSFVVDMLRDLKRMRLFFNWSYMVVFWGFVTTYARAFWIVYRCLTGDELML